MHVAIRLFVTIVAVVTSASAQLRLPKDSLDWPTPQNVLMVNPAGIAVDYLSAAYIRALDNVHALGVFGSFVYRPLGGYLPRGYGGGLLYRFHPGEQALWRFHYSVQVSYLHAWLTGRPDVAGDGIGVGASVGWQWFPVESFAVGFSIGEQYIQPLGEVTNDALLRVFRLRPLLSFDVGLAW
jgi:hypothetical protein